MNKSGYFQLVAQIIPIFLLAVSVQSSYIQKLKFEKRDWFSKGIHVQLFAFFVLVLSVGEIAALYAVYSGDFNNGLLQATIVSLLAGLYLIAAQYIVSLKDIKDDTATSLTLSYFGGVGVVIVSIVALFVIKALQ